MIIARLIYYSDALGLSAASAFALLLLDLQGVRLHGQ